MLVHGVCVWGFFSSSSSSFMEVAVANWTQTRGRAIDTALGQVS